MSGRSRKVKKSAESKLWKLPWVLNFRTLIHFYVVLVRVFGYLPYKIESSRYVFSRPQLAWSTIMMIFQVCALLYSIYEINYTDKKINYTSVIVHYNIILSLGLINVFSGFASCHSKIHALQRVSNLARKLSSQALGNAVQWTIINDVVKLTPVIFFIPFMLEAKVIFVGVAWFMFILTMAFNSLYVINVRVVKACFWHINHSLVRVREILLKDEPHLLRRVYHTQRNPMLLTELRTLKRQHLEISEVVQLINETFSLEVIGTIALTLVDTTFNLYFCLLLMTDTNVSDMSWSIQLMYLIFYIWNLIAMVWVCESATDQAKEIGSNIHRTLVTTFDEQVTTELEMFSVQVLQQDNTFSAKGLMTDATLLTKVASTITTYLLILIQFLLIKPC